MAWKSLRTTGSRVGSSSLSSSTGSESAPGAFQFASPGLPTMAPRTLALPRVILVRTRFATALRMVAAAVPSSAALPSRQ